MTNVQHPSDQRVWFITGGGSGIGRELAAAALERGDRVVVATRRTKPLQDLSARHPETLLTVETDVRDEQAVRDAVDAAVSAFGRIDVVANNAGYGVFGGVEEASDARARAVFDTNVFGVLNVLRATLPVLRRQRSGHILQGSSFYGQTAHPGVGMVSATKYAVEGISDALAPEVAPLGIKVTIVEPGPTATAFLANLDFSEAIEDYDRSVRVVQAELGQAPPEAFASPERAARALLTVVDADEPPLRIALGAQAENDMRAALQARLKDLDDWSELARSVDQ